MTDQRRPSDHIPLGRRCAFQWPALNLRVAYFGQYQLTLKMLDDPNSDYNIWSGRAGGLKKPKVAAIVMTMVGARSATKGVKDLASQMYIERAYNVAAKHAKLFDLTDPADAFVITDDFMSAGRISGALSIPIPQLKVNQFHRVAGNRLQVNESQLRYKTELEYLTSII